MLTGTARCCFAQLDEEFETPADREVIRLAGWEGLDRTALAETLDCSPNAVTKRLNRALDRLGRELGVVERTRSRFFRRGQVAR